MITAVPQSLRDGAYALGATRSETVRQVVLRAALPGANPSAYIGSSTGVGTPVAILCIPLFMALADLVIGF